MYKKLLATLDGSTLAESVLPHVEELARQFGSELILLEVVTTPVAVGTYDLASASALETLREAALDNAKIYLADQEASVAERGISVRAEVVEGDPIECILHYANEWDVDLIAMATHGRSGLGRWVYGSVAERVLRGSDRPVLLIRAQEQE